MVKKSLLSAIMAVLLMSTMPALGFSFSSFVPERVSSAYTSLTENATPWKNVIKNNTKPLLAASAALGASYMFPKAATVALTGAAAFCATLYGLGKTQGPVEHALVATANHMYALSDYFDPSPAGDRENNQLACFGIVCGTAASAASALAGVVAYKLLNR